MLGLNHTDPRVKIVRLSRNFGHQMAISAGIDFADGDAVIVMDGDLQHPPEVVPEFIERWRGRLRDRLRCHGAIGRRAG